MIRLTRRRFWIGSIAALSALIGGGLSLSANPSASADSPSGIWSAAGTLLESCTCAVPCTCNFGEGPSPHPYCHAVFAYRLEKATWGGTDLSGLIIGGADGPKGRIGFLDNRASAAQRSVLEQLARAVFAEGGPASGSRRFVPARITHSVQGENLQLDIPGHGGFRARVITGRDGKSPVVVENNTVWPIPRAIKGKAQPLAYRDATVGAIQGDGTNANYGRFSLSGSARSAAAATATAPTARASKSKASLPGCCAPAGHKRAS